MKSGNLRAWSDPIPLNANYQATGENSQIKLEPSRQKLFHLSTEARYHPAPESRLTLLATWPILGWPRRQ
jgi:hypothetical protein